MTNGLGLDSFLGHGKDRGGGKRKFFTDWKKQGSAIVWLSTRAPIVHVSWHHAFNENAIFKDKETGEEKEYLKFNRYVSPDPEVVHKNQYFRNDDDTLQVPPLLDPFLLLREWLRKAEDIPLNATVFEWYDHRNREAIKWTRGHVARLVDRGKNTWNHSLDTKLEYLMVVVADDKPEDGPQIVRVARSLGEKMQKAIRKEIDSEDEKGNPLRNPYAFKWTYDKDARSFNDQYDAARYNKARLTDEVLAAITATDYPDPSSDAAPRVGDKARIRAAMEDAARIDIPWDRIFVPAWKDGVDSPDARQFSDAEPDASFEFGANVPVPEKVPEVKGGRTRAKKQAPPPEPEVEKIPCDDCGHPMLPTDEKCSKCGAEYSVNADEPAKASPEPTRAATPPAEAAKPDATQSPQKCYACGQGPIVKDTCQNCGIEVIDEMPY